MRTGKLMIIGAGGRVGRLVIPAMRRLGAGVVLAHRGGDRLTTDFDELIWDPLAGSAPYAAWVAQNGAPGAVLVLAGATPSTKGDMSVNVTIAQAVQAAIGPVRLMLASSSAVYGSGRATPWHERDAAHPTTDYGHAKLAMERACAAPTVTALRIGNVAGADALLTNPARPLVIHRFAGGHGPCRSYIGPDSLARVLLRLSDPELAVPSVLNLATPRPVDMTDLAEAAGLPWEWTDAPPQAIGQLTLECSTLEQIVGFDPAESTPKELVAQVRNCQKTTDI